jgi:hexosaminidase
MEPSDGIKMTEVASEKQFTDAMGTTPPGQATGATQKSIEDLESSLKRWKTSALVLGSLCVGLAAGLIAASIIAASRTNEDSPTGSGGTEWPPYNANAPMPGRIPSHGYLWPTPASMSFGVNTVAVSRTFAINARNTSARLNRAIARYRDLLFPLPLSPQANATELKVVSSLIVSLNSNVGDDTVPIHLQSEAYRLRIFADGTAARLSCDSSVGCIRGLETFLQLVEPISSFALYLDANRTVSPVSSYVIYDCPLTIVDEPRFSWRGVMLDTSRHYFPVADLKRIFDGMSAAKLNIFHWHIVDAQSFPFSFTALPELAAAGAYSPAEVYTEADVRDLVAYASDRGINIVPEFDLPGHGQSWGRALPNITVGPPADSPFWGSFCYVPPCGQLNVQDPSGAVSRLLDTLFKTIVDLFPFPYLHLGGDEINLSLYNTFLRGYSSADLARFFERLYTQVDPLNRTIIHWQDLLTDNPSVFIDPAKRVLQVWGDPSLVKTMSAKGFKVIASPSKWLYLDCGVGDWRSSSPKYWCDPYKTWRVLHLFDPSPEEDPNVLGAEVPLWTEATDPGNLESVLWPRSAAAAERWWSPKDTAVNDKEFGRTRKRFDAMRSRLVRRGIKAAPVWPEWCYEGSGNYCH